jgi:hypothetical protein
MNCKGAGRRVTLDLPNERVDFGSLYIVQFLHCILNLTFVRRHINDKDQSVVLLYFFHRRFCVQWAVGYERSEDPGTMCSTNEMMVLNWSILGACGIDFLGYFGSLGSRSVLGR